MIPAISFIRNGLASGRVINVQNILSSVGGKISMSFGSSPMSAFPSTSVSAYHTALLKIPPEKSYAISFYAVLFIMWPVITRIRVYKQTLENMGNNVRYFLKS